jgi:hypothetical protein
VIFLDVDGPLITFSGRPANRAPGLDTARAAQPGGCGNPLLGRLDPEDGRRLLELGCDLVWATTWMADANEVISPLLGLPELPRRRLARLKRRVAAWPALEDDIPDSVGSRTLVHLVRR